MAQSRVGWPLAIGFLLSWQCCCAGDLSSHGISRLIDQRLEAKAGEGSPTFADDAAFLRRLSLDLVGRIPKVAEVREFLEDDSETKRDRAIERLLDSGAHYKNMATFWRRAWVPQADTPEFADVADGFELWLSHELRRQTSYDRLVAKVVIWNLEVRTSGAIDPGGFYSANESSPANLAASSTRAFLGINLDCAQCHNHPFARWTREQFWQTAAFFASPAKDGDGKAALPKVRIPDSELEYEPALLSAQRVDWPSDLDTVALRKVLADWMTSERNLYLAKNAVNRLFSHFFGEAIVEPMDDLSSDAAASGARAELLAELAQAFVASGYDLRLLVEAMVRSDAYRLASHPSANSPSSDSESIARSSAVVRGLTGEQLYDSLRTAAGLPPERSDVGRGSRLDQRKDFISVFYVERAHNAERSISQALALMNGSLVSELSAAANNPLLAGVLASPFMSRDEQIDTVFIAVLGRHAGEAERQAVLRRFEARPDAEFQEKLGDLFWVLVNSPEFNANH